MKLISTKKHMTLTVTTFMNEIIVVKKQIIININLKNISLKYS